MFAFIALSVALAAGSLAMPAALSARQDACTALGAGASNSLTYNFQLEVVNPSAADDATGAVLALLQGGQNGNWWLEEIHQNYTGEFSGWTLSGGALTPIASSTNSGNVGSDLSVATGSIVEFAVTNNGSGNAAAGQTPYCAVSDASGHATLAVNGDANSFAVCQSGTASVLVYSAVADNGGAYTFDSCNVQTVHLVQA